VAVAAGGGCGGGCGRRLRNESPSRCMVGFLGSVAVCGLCGRMSDAISINARRIPIIDLGILEVTRYQSALC
jgi:hypothetical protein